MFARLFRKFSHPIRGLVHALTKDRAFQMQVFAIGPAIGVCAYFLSPLSQLEILFIGLAWALILITELQNSALEEALDRLHPELDDHIKRSKDMAAGSTLLSGMFLLFVLIAVGLF